MNSKLAIYETTHLLSLIPKSRSSRSTPMSEARLFRPLFPVSRSIARQFIALTLVFASMFSIGPTAPLFAQVAAAPMMLHITILDGEDALNDIRERTAREPVVQVEDENHKPVAGALILFSLQNGGTGAGGTFNGLSTLSVTTDAQGRAVAHGLKLNATSGSYTIAVTATLGALVATAVIHQSLVAGGGGGAATAPPSAPPATPAAPPGRAWRSRCTCLRGTNLHNDRDSHQHQQEHTPGNPVQPHSEEGLDYRRDHRHRRCRCWRSRSHSWQQSHNHFGWHWNRRPVNRLLHTST